MAKKTVLAKKRRGPKPTGKGTQVVVRLQPAPLAALDEWVEAQPDKPTRAEAIRRLVELGLLASANYPELRYQNKATESAEKASKLARQLGLKARK